jgi:hypothetical protein
MWPEQDKSELIETDVINKQYNVVKLGLFVILYFPPGIVLSFDML